MRLYLIPVKRICNSNCTFCFMKDKKPNSNPNFMDINRLKELIQDLRFDEVEITGGGEPTLHPQIKDIISMLKDTGAYIKMYTNGFNLIDIKGVDELNISRVHHNTLINNKFYRAKYPIDIVETLIHYRPQVEKIRMQTILLKGALDSEDKFKEFIDLTGDYVDRYMVRTLFTKCDREKDNYVDFNINHSKVVKDLTLDNYVRDLLFLNTNMIVKKEFDYD